MVRVSLKWVSGTKNPNTRRILYEHDIEIGNTENYAETIDDILIEQIGIENYMIEMLGE